LTNDGSRPITASNLPTSLVGYDGVIVSDVLNYRFDRNIVFLIAQQRQALIASIEARTRLAATLSFSRISEQQQLNWTFAQRVINGLGVLPFGTGVGGSTNRANTRTSLKLRPNMSETGGSPARSASSMSGERGTTYFTETPSSIHSDCRRSACLMEWV